MKLHCRLAFLSVAYLLVGVSVAAAQWPGGSPELRAGIQASKEGKNDEAIAHFEKAVMADPTNASAHFYLAAAYAQQYVPGVDKTDNIAMGEKAIAEYQKVTEINSSRGASRNANRNIGYLYIQMAKFDEAKDSYAKAKELDPMDPEPYYSVAYIDWIMTSQFREQERKKLGLKPEESLAAKDKTVCGKVRDKNWSNLDEGISNLNKALELRPDYFDAMSSMSLLYRERADVECYDLPSRTADLKAADEWQSKALIAKKNAGKKPASKSEDD